LNARLSPTQPPLPQPPLRQLISETADLWQLTAVGGTGRYTSALTTNNKFTTGEKTTSSRPEKKNMDPNRNESMKAGGAMGGNGPDTPSVTNSLARGKEAMGTAAADAMDQGAADLKALRRDLNNLTDTVMKFVSEAGSEAAKSAGEITSSMTGQVSNVASGMADKGANLASSTTQQAKTFATELESMARRNPLGAIAGAVMIGVLIGMIGRRNG
jgi:ElaB/YqjD/DUF883 family membrane-anchored ribosome-binding protein